MSFVENGKNQAEHLIEKHSKNLCTIDGSIFSLACSHFIDLKEGFYNIDFGATKSEKSKSHRSKVESELCSSLAEPLLITIAYFLRGYHVLFWKPHFDWLKIVDPIEKVSSCALRNVSAREFTVHLNLMKLKINWPVESEFQQFISRKELHDDNKNKLLCDSLPS